MLIKKIEPTKTVEKAREKVTQQTGRIMNFLETNIKGVKIIYGKTIKGVPAHYESAKKMITISPRFKDDPKVLAHEIAHAVAVEKWHDPTHRRFGTLGLYMGIDLFAYAKGHKTARALNLTVKDVEKKVKQQVPKLLKPKKIGERYGKLKRLAGKQFKKLTGIQRMQLEKLVHERTLAVGIDPQEIDIQALTDPTLNYEENVAILEEYLPKKAPSMLSRSEILNEIEKYEAMAKEKEEEIKRGEELSEAERYEGLLKERAEERRKEKIIPKKIIPRRDILTPVLDIIKELEKEYGTAQKSEITERAMQEGIPEREAEKAIEKLRLDGHIYDPVRNERYKVV